MAEVIVINRDQAEPFVRLRAALEDKRPILERIGAILEEGAQRAFIDQAFGDFKWPPRYPNQSAPFISVAGAVQDFREGRAEPKSRRFNRRPALRDKGTLLGSIRSAVTGEDTVEAGTTVPYADVHQWGGVSSQPIDKGTRDRLAKWLRTTKGEPFRPKMLPVLQKNRTSWDTEVVQRPFLGVTPQMEEDIAKTVEDMITEGASGGG